MNHCLCKEVRVSYFTVILCIFSCVCICVSSVLTRFSGAAFPHLGLGMNTFYRLSAAQMVPDQHRGQTGTVEVVNSSVTHDSSILH